MFLIEKGTTLTFDKITEIIQQFNTRDRVRLQKYFDYYSGKQEIMMKRKVSDGKPCNRVVTNYALNIVNNYQGYLTGKDISYSSVQEFEKIQDTLNYNDVQQADSELLRNALIYGVAYEICYIDEEKQQRFKVLDSRNCIPIYENTLD
jgi:SPP1 family phage portal protein